MSLEVPREQNPRPERLPDSGQIPLPDGSMIPYSNRYELHLLQSLIFFAGKPIDRRSNAAQVFAGDIDHGFYSLEDAMKRISPVVSAVRKKLEDNPRYTIETVVPTASERKEGKLTTDRLVDLQAKEEEKALSVRREDAGVDPIIVPRIVQTAQLEAAAGVSKRSITLPDGRHTQRINDELMYRILSAIPVEEGETISVEELAQSFSQVGQRTTIEKITNVLGYISYMNGSGILRQFGYQLEVKNGEVSYQRWQPRKRSRRDR